MTTRLLSIIMAALFIAGCTTTGSQPSSDDTPNPSDRFTEEDAFWQELRRISIEARDELRLLAKAEQTMMLESATPEQHEQRFFQSTYVPDGFEKIVTFNFTGPISTGAEAIAKVAGYKFRILGEPIPREPHVEVSVEREALINALHQLGMYTGDSIRIDILEAERRIDFRYQPR